MDVQAVNIRPVADLRSKFNEIEAILSETDHLAASDARRFAADEIYKRLKAHVHVGKKHVLEFLLQ